MGHSILYKILCHFEEHENSNFELKFLFDCLDPIELVAYSVLSWSHITSVIDALIFPERFRRSDTCHRALPQQSPLILFLLVLGQLTRDAVHDSTIMENDHVTLLPSMGIDVFGGIYLLLHVVYHLPHFFDIIHDLDLACRWVPCGELIHTAAVYL
jgi:hypothetical protein